MKRAGLVTALLATAFVVIPLTGHAQKKAGALKLDPQVLTGPKGEKFDGAIGLLTVPENRNNPNSRLIDLKFAKFNTTSKNPGAPIIYLAGGPGGSGIAAARGARFPLFMAMREIGDVIAFDQRGTGASEASTNCTEKFTFAPDQPLTREKALELFRVQGKACRDRLIAQGIDLAGYNTNESADDIEDLRKALGAPKISLWGISYGTHLAIATVRRHESSIDKVILAGVEGPEHTLKLPTTTQKHLDEIDRRMKLDPELAKLIPSFPAMVKETLDRVENEPVAVEVADGSGKSTKVVITKFALQLMTAFAFGGDEGRLPALYYGMSKGDFNFPARRWLSLANGAQAMPSGMAQMMDCYSGVAKARLARVKAEAKTTFLADAIDFPFPDVCDVWGNPDLGDAFRKNIKTKVLALFISGNFDVRTPPSNAEEVRSGFKSSYHLIIDGAVHSDPLFLSSPKILQVMLQFMRGEKPETLNISLAPIKFEQVSK
ncbi:MAG: alpha/beta fold hydrolase [Pyrinomonadaceae bacterium]